MAKRLFVGSLSWNVTDDQLKEFFSTVGTVASATVITDRDTGRSKGFGFVEMSSDEEADTAIHELNGKKLDDREVVVNEARPREERSSSPRGNSFDKKRGGSRRDYGRDRGSRY